MKKLFVAVLAIAALAACNKDNDMKFIESNKKAVSIVIANGVSDTRALGEVPAFDTNDGATGTIEDKAVAGACASTEQLVVLFANSANTVVEAWKFADADASTYDGDDSVATGENYAYLFHNISESVTQVAVVRTTETTHVGKNLSVYQQAAANVDALENVDLATIPLYGNSGLTANGTCTVPTDHNTSYTYNLYTAEIDVVPTIARVEIVGFACDGGTAADGIELGTITGQIAEGQPLTGGYDSLNLEKIEWGAAKEYKYTFAEDQTLLGVYAGGVTDGKYNTRDRVDWTAGVDKVIAWNIDPTAAVPTIDASEMVVTMHANRIDNPIPANNNTKTLSIGFDGITSFEPGKIYRMDVHFGENNLDESNEAICVEVEVEIANWVVVEVTPVFGNN